MGHHDAGTVAGRVRAAECASPSTVRVAHRTCGDESGSCPLLVQNDRVQVSMAPLVQPLYLYISFYLYIYNTLSLSLVFLLFLHLSCSVHVSLILDQSLQTSHHLVVWHCICECYSSADTAVLQLYRPGGQTAVMLGVISPFCRDQARRARELCTTPTLETGY